jgi:predicted transposase/invertase (TIGR01784 family)
VGQDWDFELKHVYLIAILDFVFDEDKNEAEKFRYDVKLSDIETCKVFYNKLTFVYLEMPKFNKSEQELKTKYDKWLFVLKNLNKLDRMPGELKEKIFLKLFKIAEIAKLDKTEFKAYQESLNAYRDIKNSVDTAWEEGEQKGFEKGRIEGEIKGKIEGKIETAKNGLKMGLPVEVICKMTGLSIEEIEKLKA